MILQICIALFGLSALAGSMFGSPAVRRWAPIVGLMGQPFWLASTIHAEQWGMVALCSCYTLVYLWGTLRAFHPVEVEVSPGAELDRSMEELLKRIHYASVDTPVTRDRCVTGEPAMLVLPVIQGADR